VFEIELLFIIRASHAVCVFEFFAPFAIFTSPLNVFIPEPLLMDFEIILLVVFGARWYIFPPVSCVCPSPANARDCTSPWAPSSISITAGYFILVFEPMLQSSHFISPFLYTFAFFVTRLYMFSAQFCTVVY